MNIRISYLVFLFLIIGGCTRDLDIPFPEHESRLTLNSFIVEGSTPFLSVTRSFGALETISDTGILVKDANVELWQNGSSISTFQYKDSVYNDTLDAFEYEPGKFEYYIESTRRAFYFPMDELPIFRALESYEFRASHPSYGEATAQVTVVPQPEILGIEVVKDSIVTRDFDDGYQDTWTAVKVRLRDPGEIANYYNFSALVRYADSFVINQQRNDTLIWPEIVATEIVREADGVVYGENEPISDQEFDGLEHTLTVFIRLPGCCGYPDELARQGDFLFYSVDVTSFMMDESYGIFQQKRELQRYNRTEGIEGALIPTEPVSVSGNVEGGYGLVGSFSSITRRFIFEN